MAQPAAQHPPKRIDKRGKIIDAAIHIFAQKGFYDSKISDIAAEAGVADGTIYLYFANKEDLIIHVFEESVNRFILHIRAELSKESNPAEKLRRLIVLHLDLVCRHPELAQVIQVELRRSSKFMKGYNRGKFIDYLGIISDIVQEGQEKGVFRTDLSHGFLRRIIFGALDTIALYWVLSKKRRHPIEYYAEQLTGLVLGGLMDRKVGVSPIMDDREEKVREESL